MKLGRYRVLITLVLLAVVIVGVVAAVSNMNSTSETPSTQTTQTLESISPQAYQSEIASADHVLIDVRTPEEFASGHIAGAVNIPIDTLSGRLSEVPNDAPVVVYCRTGNRSAQAAQILKDADYSTIYDLGGVVGWTQAGLPLE